MTIENNDLKPSHCSLRCPFINIIGSPQYPTDAYCELYHENLKCYLSFEDYKWLWVHRCTKCIDDFGGINQYYPKEEKTEKEKGE